MYTRCCNCIEHNVIIYLLQFCIIFYEVVISGIPLKLNNLFFRFLHIFINQLTLAYT